MQNGSKELARTCGQIHQIVSKLPLRYGRVGLDRPSLPTAGIYFIYEEGEILSNKAILTHGTGCRIVRVGTHTEGRKEKPRTLRERLLRDHFGTSREGSIQRKYIGAALMSREGRSTEEIDTWKRKRKGNPDYKNSLNNRYEELVTDYFYNKMPFRCLSVPKEDDRFSLERRIIATIAKCPLCKALPDWLGKYCYNKRVVDSELWNVQHTEKRELVKEDDFELLIGFADAT